jgi:hypothetical protein
MFYEWLFNKMRSKLYYYGYYKIEDLQTWGHCGCCGKPINREIFPKDWAWGICQDCINGKIEITTYKPS